MSQFTPGPWIYNGNEIVAESDPNKGIAGALTDDDARLIAETPALLAALEEINTKAGGLFAAMGHGLEIGERVWDEAFAALEKGRQVVRKARGEV